MKLSKTENGDFSFLEEGPSWDEPKAVNLVEGKAIYHIS